MRGKGNFKLPTFLVAGAARAGTTSLYHYFKQHPEVFMSTPKEPNFLSGFHEYPAGGLGYYSQNDVVRTFEDYAHLFQRAQRAKAVGEASPDTLYHYEQAIPNIKKYLDNPKIIITLRNPLERAFSAYSHLALGGREPLSFEDALDKEAERIKAGWRFICYYIDAGKYYRQVKAFLDEFHHVKICLFDDLVRDTGSVMRELFDFIEVDPSFETDVRTVYNMSGRHAGGPSVFFYSILANPATLLRRTIIPASKLLLGENRYYRLRNSAKKKVIKKSEMSQGIREQLCQEFRDDIRSLERLIDRDLSSWYCPVHQVGSSSNRSPK